MTSNLFGNNSGDAADDALRRAWRTLTDETLPMAAKSRPDWPVRLNHCFARILLDNAFGMMWRDAVKPPAWRNTPPENLRAAIELGHAVLRDEADISALNNESLRLRGKNAAQTTLPRFDTPKQGSLIL